MATKPQYPPKHVTFHVSTQQRPDVEHPLAAYVFDARGELVERAHVRDEKVELTLPTGELARHRVFIAPAAETLDPKKPTPAMLERLSAYEPVLQAGGPLLDCIAIRSVILDLWPFRFCWVPEHVVRRSDNRAVCNAWVHICEVDRVARLISKPPDPDVLRLRDDLLDIIRNAPIPRPIPDPDPEPFPPGSGPRPESAAFRTRYYGSPRIWARSLASTCSLPRLTGVSVSIRSRSRRCRAASFQQ
jgi:hypothetical protein